MLRHCSKLTANFPATHQVLQDGNESSRKTDDIKSTDGSEDIVKGGGQLVGGILQRVALVAQPSLTDRIECGSTEPILNIHGHIALARHVCFVQDVRPTVPKLVVYPDHRLSDYE